MIAQLYQQYNSYFQLGIAHQRKNNNDTNSFMRLFGLFFLLFLCFYDYLSCTVSAQSLYQSRGWGGTTVDPTKLTAANMRTFWNQLPTTKKGYCSTFVNEWYGITNSGNGALAQCPSGANSKLFYHMSAVFYVSAKTQFDFRYGADLRYGGQMLIDDNPIAGRFYSEMKISGQNGCTVNNNPAGNGCDGMWWNRYGTDPNFPETHKDEFLEAMNLTMTPGTHTLEVYGAEECCDGPQNFRFRKNSGGVNDKTSPWIILSIAALNIAPPTFPAVYAVYPQLQSTDGGTRITVVGDAIAPAIITLVPQEDDAEDYDVGPVTCSSNTTCSFTLPPGAGVPYITVSSLGRQALPLPTWSGDASFSATPPSSQNLKQCVKIYAKNAVRGWDKTPDTSSTSTAINLLCIRDGSSRLSFVFTLSATAPTTAPNGLALTCISFIPSLNPNDWTNAKFCWPTILPYTFSFLDLDATPSGGTGKTCLKIIQASDPQFNSGNIRLCVPTSQAAPYGNLFNPVYQYSPPVVQSVSTLSGDTVGGGNLTITGTNFGFNSIFGNSTTLSVSIGSKSCPVTVWQKNKIVCIIPAGEGVNNLIVVTVDGQTNNNATLFYVYNRPVISSYAFASGPRDGVAGGGGTLNITGKNFGTTPVTVQITSFTAPKTCLTLNQRDNFIQCTLPQGQNGGLNLVVTTDVSVGAQASTPYPFNYTIPTVTSIIPSTSSTIGKVTVVINGYSFGAILNNVYFVSAPTSPYVVAGTQPPNDYQCTSSTYTDTQITCTNSPGVGSNLRVKILVGSSTNDMSLPIARFDYSAPTITAVTPRFLKNGGSLLISGSNFGTNAGVGDATRNFVTVGSLSCAATSTSYLDNLISCTVPAGQTGTNLLVKVTTWNQQSQEIFNFGYSPKWTDPPINPPTSGGIAMNLTSVANFGSGAALYFFSPNITVPLTCYAGTTSCGFIMPPGVGGNNQASVSINGQLPVGTEAQYWTYRYAVPVLIDFFPKGGSGAGGFILTIIGQNFGTPILNAANPLSVYLGSGSDPSKACNITTPLSYNHTYLTCRMPPGSGSDSKNLIRISVAGATNTESINYNYARPTITEIYPLVGNRPVLGNVPITIVGAEFRDPVIVTFDKYSYSITPASIKNTANISMVLPAGTGQVSVTVSSNAVNSDSFLFEYDHPILDSVNVVAGGLLDTDGGDIIVRGSNFGSADSNIQVKINPGAQQCTPKPPAPTDTTANCNVPPSDGSSISISVTSTSGQSNSLPLAFTPPTIASVFPTHGPTKGGTLMAINGKSFGTGSGGIVTVGGKVCDTTTSSSIWSHRSIICVLPDLLGQNLTVVVSRPGGDTIYQGNTYTYSTDMPVITSVLTTGGAPTVGGGVLTIKGVNFGPAGSSVVTFRGSTALCGSTGFPNDHENAYCSLPAGEGKNYPVFITVAGLYVSNVNTQFRYDAPVLLDTALSQFGASNTHSPAAGNIRITLGGSNFGANGTNSLTVGNTRIPDQNIVYVTSDRTQIVFTAPPGFGTNLAVSVNTSSQIATLANPSQSNGFNYDTPSVTRLLGCDTPAGTGVQGCSIDGASLTIIGTNFGVYHHSPYTTVEVLILVDQTTIVCTVAYANDTQIICSFPASPRGGFGLPLKLTFWSADMSNSYVIPSTSPTKMSFAGPTFVDGSAELISDNTGALFTPTRRLLGTGNSLGNIQLNTTNGGATIQFSAMYISLNASQIQVRYGFSAAKLQLNDGSIEAFNAKQYPCVNVTLNTTTGVPNLVYVSCSITEGIGQNLVFQVRSSQQYTLDSHDLISYALPVIRPFSISLSTDRADWTASGILSGQDNQGDTIYLDVDNVGGWPAAFNPDGTYPIAVQMYDPITGTVQNCTNEQGYVNNDVSGHRKLISCNTGLDSNAAGTASVYQFRLFHNRDFNFSGPLQPNAQYKYQETPVIYGVTGCSLNQGNGTTNCPTIGGITLSFFVSQINLAVDQSIRIGGKDCTNLVASNLTNIITCTLPIGAGSNVPVIYTNGRLISAPANLISYAPPTIISVTGCDQTSIRPSYAQAGIFNCARTGGNRITIIGTNLGPPSANIIVAGTQCQSVFHNPTDPTNVTCILSGGTQINQPLFFIQQGGSAVAADPRVSYAQCGTGYFSTDTTCIACEAGTFQDIVVGATTCKACAAGRYTPSSGLSQCTDCAAGFLSASPVANFSSQYGYALGPSGCIQCQIGYASETPAALSCSICPSGTYNDGSDPTSCTPCPAGSYSDNPGLTTCKNCTEGTFTAFAGQKNCVSCPIGSTSGFRAKDCQLCAAGKFAQLGFTACQNCTIGQFNPQQGQSICGICAAGKIASTSGLSDCSICPAGKSTLAQSGRSQCTDCAAGYFSPIPGSPDCQQCLQGSANPNPGSSSCTLCPRGYFQGSPAQLNCLPCDAGSYTAINGSVTCSICPGGTYSASQHSTSCTNCLAGQFQPSSGSSFCYNCPSGQYNPTPAQLLCQDCASGFTSGPASTKCNSCPAGYYSLVATIPATIPVPNPNNPFQIYYAPVSGQSQCSICLAGSYSPVNGSTSCSICAFGSYASKDASTACSDCDPGSISVAPISPTQGQTGCQVCDAGTYAATRGLSVCNQCDAGKYNSLPKSTGCDDCLAGQFQTSIQSTICVNCTAGYYSPASAWTQNCVPCSPGSYNSNDQSSSCDLCPSGRYQPNANQKTCLDADKGYFVATAGSNKQTACPAGSYTDNPQQVQCTQCGQGSYQDQGAATTCIPCAKGNYTDSFGSLQCNACPRGFADFTGGGASSCDQCAAGSYSAIEGSTQCSSCTAGKAQANYGASTCNICHSGFIASSQGLKSCEPCFAGKYSSPSLDGRGRDFCSLCDISTYQDNQGQSVCRGCNSGSFSNITGLAQCTLCFEGTYQDSQSQSDCKICDPGKYADQRGQTTCTKCATGTYAATNSTTRCENCDPGYYQSDTAATECFQCRPGTYSSAPGSKDCLDCPPGYFADYYGATVCAPCEAGKAQSNARGTTCDICGPGFFAPTNASTVCSGCERGTYNNLYQATACQDCLPGSVASDVASSNCTLCSPGFFQGGKHQAACIQCTGQQYSNKYGATACDSCDARSVPTPQNNDCLCAIGYANRRLNIRNPSDLSFECVACPEGAVCDIAGQKWETMGTVGGYWEAGNKVYYKCAFVQLCPGSDSKNRQNSTLSSLFPGQSKGDIIYNLDLENHGVPYGQALAGSDDYLYASPCANNRYGPTCSLCVPGTIETFGGTCSPCPGQQGSTVVTFVVIALVIFCVLLALYYLIIRADRPVIALAAQDEKLRIREAAGYMEEYDLDYELKKNRFDELITTKGGPKPKPNYMFKLKIFITFAQIVTNLAIGLQVSWPENFKLIISFLIPVNLDFVQVSTVGCVVDTNFYRKMIAAVIVPFAIGAGVIGCYWFPLTRFKYPDKKDIDQSISRKMVRKNTWKLIYFTMFLVYPNVSSVILRVFICDQIDGFQYLRTDYTVLCYTLEYYQYFVVGIIFAIIYPIGVPLAFFRALYRIRKRLSEIGVRAELGFLFDAYEHQVWWFELADMLHKLFLTSLVIFFPYDAQLPVAMCGSWVYTAIILCLKPYIRKSDDRLHLLAQTEISLLLLAGYIFTKIRVIDHTMDYVLTVILLFAVFFLIGFFLLQASLAVKKKVKAIIRRRAREAAAAKGINARTWKDVKELQEEEEAALEKEAQERFKFKEWNLYSSELPTLTRRDLAPHTRIAEGLKDVQMHRNIAWGMEGNNAFYDPITDDMVEETFANPLNVAGQLAVQADKREKQGFVLTKKKDIIAEKEAREAKEAMMEMARMKPREIDMELPPLQSLESGKVIIQRLPSEETEGEHDEKKHEDATASGESAAETGGSAEPVAAAEESGAEAAIEVAQIQLGSLGKLESENEPEAQQAASPTSRTDVALVNLKGRQKKKDLDDDD